MKIEEYFQVVINKIGPAAFDLARDAQIKALENIMIEKGIATREEIEAEQELQLGETAKNISQMPTASKPSHDTQKKQDSN